MASGLFALLDDVAALVKASAASLDDVPAQVARTTGKVSGVVIDDAAVTPKYVVGLDPSRELSIITRIAKKSLLNKLLILGPAALLLGLFLPWAIQPILMLGGAYLCYEGYEKIHSMFGSHHNEHGEGSGDQPKTITPEELEKERVQSAVRTDMILSAEIMAITYSTVAEEPLTTQIIVMACVAVFITMAVYGFVGLIVKADDIGLYMAREKHSDFIRKVGRGIVQWMPTFLKILGYVGTAAMLWVGAEIIAHGIPFLHHGLEDIVHNIPDVPALPWLVQVLVCAVGGIGLGALIDQLVKLGHKIFSKKKPVHS